MSNLTKYVKDELFYKSVVEDGSDIIFIVDYDGMIRYHNPSVAHTLGYDNLNGKSFFDYIHPKELKDFKKNFKSATLEPYSSSIEFQFHCSETTYKNLEFNSINLLHKEGTKGLILDCRDITQRKKDAAELIRAQKAKEQFLANMSHEIRTPINGITGMVNLLSESVVTDEQKKYISAIQNSANNLKVIINDILDISVIESGKLKFEKIGFNIEYQLDSILETFRFQAKEKGIVLTKHIDSGIQPVVLGDPVRLNQILINLINNAIKFTYTGEISVTVTAKNYQNHAVNVIFEVTDTGVGIPAEKTEKIFDSFSQADESVTRKYGGTGLGLAICRQLVELQDGRIKVKSVENVGTTFTFNIPYEIGKTSDLVSISSDEDIMSQSNASSQLVGMRILLVEDNDINRLYAANVLKNWKCEVDEAENGLICLEKLKKNPYNVILMDVQMPILDGFEAAKTIRSTFSEPKSQTPIIALTANAIKGDSERCFEAGMNDYLSKPFVPQDLYQMLVKYSDGPVDMDEKTTSQSNIIDLSYLKEIGGDNTNFILEMVQTFIDSAPADLNQMKRLSQSNSWKELGQLAHKIKPSITFMGMQSLKPLVLEIEKEGKTESNLELLPDKVDKFILECENGIEELSRQVKNGLI